MREQDGWNLFGHSDGVYWAGIGSASQQSKACQRNLYQNLYISIAISYLVSMPYYPF
jgi:hypothetical protein